MCLTHRCLCVCASEEGRRAYIPFCYAHLPANLFQSNWAQSNPTQEHLMDPNQAKHLVSYLLLSFAPSTCQMSKWSNVQLRSRYQPPAYIQILPHSRPASKEAIKQSKKVTKKENKKHYATQNNPHTIQTMQTLCTVHHMVCIVCTVCIGRVARVVCIVGIDCIVTLFPPPLRRPGRTNYVNIQCLCLFPGVLGLSSDFLGGCRGPFSWSDTPQAGKYRSQHSS